MPFRNQAPLGGRLVLQTTVEEKLQELTGSLDRSLLVTGVGDERKGERLVLLHCLDDARLQTPLAKLPQLDLPKLRMPKANQFFRLDALPLLVSAKLDLAGIREVAARYMADQ